jgi:hypothetical protein
VGKPIFTDIIRTGGKDSMNNEVKNNLFSAIEWANDYIIEYQKSGKFDPVSALTGTADKEQRIFTECVNFLHTLEEATADFKSIRAKISFE